MYFTVFIEAALHTDCNVVYNIWATPCSQKFVPSTKYDLLAAALVDVGRLSLCNEVPYFCTMRSPSFELKPPSLNVTLSAVSILTCSCGSRPELGSERLRAK